MRHKILLLVTLVGMVGTRQVNAQVVEPWPVTPEGFKGSMSLHYIALASTPSGPGKPTVNQSIIVSGLRQQAVFSGRRVRFGPFKVSTSYLSQSPLAGFGTTFTVRVLARSPQQINPLADLTEIAKVSTRLIPTGPGATATREFFVDADLPGGLNALAIEASIGDYLPGAGTVFSKFYPDSECKKRLYGDQKCLQAGINPLGVTMGLVPLSIVYEPPGQCSHASLSTSETTALAVAIDQSEVKATQTLSDVVIAAGLVKDEHTNTSWEKTNQSRKSSEVTSDTTTTVGTELAGSAAPDCRTAPDRRSSRGPGKGDLFVFAANTPLVYWNTGNLSNSRHLLPDEPLPPNLPPRDQPRPAFAFAHQLTPGSPALPDVLEFKSPEDLEAILRLDPFTTIATGNANAPVTTLPHIALDPKRFVSIWVPSIGADIPFKVERSNTDARFSVEATATKRGDHKKMVTEDSNAAFGNTMLQFGTRAGLAAATSGASEALLQTESYREQCDASPGSSACDELSSREAITSDIQDAVKSGSIPTFFQDRTETSVEVTLSESNSLARREQSGNVQSFFMRDPNRSLDVEVYYDLLFGTFAFQELPAAMGSLPLQTRLALFEGGSQRGQSGWVKTVVKGIPSTVALPNDIRTQLSGYVGGSAFSLRSLPTESFIPGAGKVAGLPAGVAVARDGLNADTNAEPGVYQQAFMVENNQGVAGGIYWQTVIVAEPGAFDQATCQRRPNPDLPETDIATCCTPAGQCDSFVAPREGTLRVEGESFASASGVSATSTGATGLQEGHWARYENIEFGPYEGIYQSIRVRARVDAVGSLEIWADGLPGQGGTRLAVVPLTKPETSCGTGIGDGVVQLDIRPEQVLPFGLHDIFVVARAPNGALGELDWFELRSSQAPAPPTVRAQLRAADVSSPADNHIRPVLRLLNDGPGAVDLSRVTTRYWYTIDTGAEEDFHIDWAAAGKQNMTGTFSTLSHPRQSADHYLELGFTASACSLAVGETTGDIQMRWNKVNWSNYNEANDHSYTGAATFADAPNVTVYVDGALVWGTEPSLLPGGEAFASGKKLRLQYSDAGFGNHNDNHVRPHFNVINDGTVDVPLEDLTIRYWFTSDTSSLLQAAVDYALLGSHNIQWKFVRLDSPRPHADHYLELRFSPSAGVLGPFGSTGIIQTRFNKADWSNFDESNDYSYSPVRTNLSDWNRVTLYRNGELVWGTEP